LAAQFEAMVINQFFGTHYTEADLFALDEAFVDEMLAYIEGVTRSAPSTSNPKGGNDT